MEKQIEEIKDCIDSVYGCDCAYFGVDGLAIADALYNAGYRKQSEGEWVKVMNHKECSKCGYNAPYKKIKAGYHLQDLSNYCPNCGAKMKGGAELWHDILMQML
jgi:ribosomal protein S27AE